MVISGLLNTYKNMHNKQTMTKVFVSSKYHKLINCVFSKNHGNFGVLKI